MDTIVNQLSRVFESWEEGVFLVDTGGKILSWNEGTKNLYGYATGDIVGKKLTVLVPFDIEDKTPEIFRYVEEQKHHTQYEIVHKKKDDSRIHVSLSISPIIGENARVIALSILVRNLSEGEQSKELFNALTQSTPIGIYVVQNGKFQFVSRQFESIIGYTSDELIGTESLSYIYPDDRELVREKAIETLKSGHTEPYEFRVVTKNAQVKWVLETIISIGYYGKRATLGNFMDITESKRLQEERRLANEKLTNMVMKLEEQNRRNKTLTEMRDMLQACSNIEETAPIIIGTMKKLFPESTGALFMLSNSRSDLESVASWGNFPLEVENNIFAPDACWGLRLGRAHVVENSDAGPLCPHLKQKPATAYVCLPLMAKGDILGLLHIQSSPYKISGQQQDISDLREIATLSSEYLSLAIANVKLGENLARQSIQDPLSGLFNRRFMEESLERELMRAKRKQTQIGIIMADIDNFKRYNDLYGHVAGDKIISQLGRLLKERIRGSDIACRYGGEEFVAILPDTAMVDAYKRANDLREEVKKMEVIFQGQVLGSITISIGVASYPSHGSRTDELLRVADTALYKAKLAGRDVVVTG